MTNSALPAGPINEVVEELVDLLGPTLVAVISGTRKRSDIPLWICQAETPSYDAALKLRTALGIARDIQAATLTAQWPSAQQFFITGRFLDGPSTAMLLRDGRFEDAKAAASAYLEDQYA